MKNRISAPFAWIAPVVVVVWLGGITSAWLKGQEVPAQAESDEVLAENVEILRRKLKSPELDVRKMAAEILDRYGPAAKGALPELIDILLDPDDRAWYLAKNAVAKIGRPAVAPMIKAYRAATDKQRLHMVGLMGELYRDGDTELEAVLLETLADRSKEAHQRAIAAVTRGNVVKRAMPLVIDILADKNAAPESRRAAAAWVGRFGPDAKRAIPILLDILHDERNDIELRSNAVSVASIARNDRNLTLMFRKILADEKQPERMRQGAAGALAGMDDGQSAADDLVKVLQKLGPKDGSSLFVACMDSLSKFTPNKEAVPILIQIFEAYQGHTFVSKAALELLAKIGPDAAPAVPRVLTVLDGPMLIRLQKEVAALVKNTNGRKLAEERLARWNRTFATGHLAWN